MFHRIRRYGVALGFVFAFVEGVFEEHVAVEGIIFGRRLFLAHRVVDGSPEFGFLGQEASEVGLYGEVVLLVVVETPFVQALVDTSEAGSLYMCSDIHGGYVRHRECGVGFCSPTAIFVEIGHFKLVDPHDAVFLLVCELFRTPIRSTRTSLSEGLPITAIRLRSLSGSRPV